MKTIEMDPGCEVDSIRHSGIVKQIDEQYIYVSIIAQSACVSCHAKGVCNVNEIQEEVVEVPRLSSYRHEVGDKVEVQMKKSLGTRAVMLGYVIPFLLVLASMITLIVLTGDEGIAGLVSLLVLVPYYYVLYLLKNRLKHTFSFTIR